MRELVETLRTWWRTEEPFALAVVVGVRGSAPRPPGTAMAVNARGEVAGSVSGGCVEGAVYDSAQRVLQAGVPTIETYGISDEAALNVGLTCGGEIDVLVRPITRQTAQGFDELAGAVASGDPVAVAIVVGGPAPLGAQLVVRGGATGGTLGAFGLDAAVADEARGMLALGQTGLRHFGPNGERRRDEVTMFVQSLSPPPRMLVFGAIDFAAAVVRIGKFLGYHVTVCDARPVFATTKRFPDADEVVCAWPHDYLAGASVDERTVIAVLTHDPKFDVPLLEAALRTPAAYIGAMGSRRTHEDRLERLRAAGVSALQLSRLRSPVGLDLGALTPEETAISIAAEIIAMRLGGSGRPLSETDGSIHAHEQAT